jgi:hypothetical protein
MKLLRSSFGLVFILLLSSCGKSSKLTALLPEAPEGWKADGSASTKDVSGVGHSSTKSYIPASTAAGMGTQRVTVQILTAEKGGDQKQLQSMALENKAMFKERKEVGGYPAYESFPLPDNDTHSLDIMPASGKWVQIVAYKGGGADWENGANRQKVVSGFAAKIDLKKVADQE